VNKLFKTLILLLFLGAVYVIITNISNEPVNANLIPEVKTSGNSGTDVKRNCGTMDYLNDVYAKNPGYKKTLEELNNYAIEYSKIHAGEKNNVLVTIPVVVHVVYNNGTQNISYEQIKTQIDVMNLDFRRLNADTVNTPSVFKSAASDPMIQFCLAQRDPLNNPSLGITRTYTTHTSFGLDDAVKFTSSGGHDVWDRNKYLNLWVCNLGSGLLGYATFPGGNPATDGVVIGYQYFGTIGTASPPYNLGRTATHEIGHWLQLYHIWGDDNGACWGSDEVEDTPNQGPENYGCPAFPNISCNNGPNGDMFMNYMDYTDDGCMNIFTNGQSVRMSSALNGPRAPILTSNGCVPVSGTPIALFSADSVSVLYGGSVHFADLSAGIPAGWNWTFDGGNPSASNIQNPAVTYNNPGLYTVKLRVSNSFGSDSLIRTSYIRVRGAALSTFVLVSPPSLERIVTSPSDFSTVNFIWTKSSVNPAVTYNFKIRKFGSMVDLLYPSNNSGADSVISLRKSFLDTLANNFGITGDSVRCIWRVYAYNNGMDSIASSNVFIVTLVRSVIGIQQISSDIPERFNLYNNYPNPFNPSTTIKFDVAKMQNVKITVYDVLGRLVNVLVNRQLQPGTFEAKWDASAYSSGIYYFRMESESFSDTRKMVLVK
jgi:PKD repeat protein